MRKIRLAPPKLPKPKTKKPNYKSAESKLGNARVFDKDLQRLIKEMRRFG